MHYDHEMQWLIFQHVLYTYVQYDPQIENLQWKFDKTNSKVKLTPSVNHFTLENSERGGSDKSDGIIFFLWLKYYFFNSYNWQITSTNLHLYKLQTTRHFDFLPLEPRR